MSSSLPHMHMGVYLNNPESPVQAEVAPASIQNHNSAAGRVSDLYKAVAKLLNLASGEAQKLLLLAEYASNQTLAMHTQGSKPLSTVQITNGPGHFSSSKPLLLAYHYASVHQGPSSGKQLLVYNRCLGCSQRHQLKHRLMPKLSRACCCYLLHAL